MDTKTMQTEILRLKKETDTLLVAHLYQSVDIIEVADVVGDSFALSVAATKHEQKRVLVSGVRFMAETVKILSPEKTVLLPRSEAGCPMAEQIAPERVVKFKKENPDTAIVCYVNTSAALKAECDVCVTSSSAVKIVSSLLEKDILFIPDKHLGAYIAKKLPEKNFIFWDGYCPIHAGVTADDVRAVRASFPNALLATHPESAMEVLELSDFVGATTQIIDFAKNTDKPVIFGTESGVYNYMSLLYPDRPFAQLAPHKLICPDMKITTLSNIYKTLKGLAGEEITVEEKTRLRAKKALDNMVEYGK